MSDASTRWRRPGDVERLRAAADLVADPVAESA
jgi:hypothetical protein